jgi:hypothetical protein
MMIEGSGSGRPKNMWIRWIRIRNRASNHLYLLILPILPAPLLPPPSQFNLSIDDITINQSTSPMCAATLLCITNQNSSVLYVKHKMATYGKEKIEPIGYRFKALLLVAKLY